MEGEESKKEPEQPKKKKDIAIALSDLDLTMIKLHELFQNNDVMVSLNLKLDEHKGEFKRSFQILSCDMLVGGNPIKKRPEYFG